ncbi:MAG: hypothetical protein JO048_02575 [Methylobacteriaceae bacterium]|nr:hypothetical protein [Methylobacteriaceae bacterium]
MRVMLISAVAAILVATGAAFFLGQEQRFAYQAFATTGARVTPSSNLVGPRWTGDPDVPSKSGQITPPPG